MLKQDSNQPFDSNVFQYSRYYIKTIISTKATTTFLQLHKMLLSCFCQVVSLLWILENYNYKKNIPKSAIQFAIQFVEGKLFFPIANIMDSHKQKNNCKTVLFAIFLMQIFQM